MTDTRPAHSPADAEMAAVVHRASERIERIASDAAIAVGMLPGIPAERRHDALSVYSILATDLAARLLVQLSASQQLTLGRACEVVLLDLEHRLRKTAAEIGSMLPTVQ